MLEININYFNIKIGESFINVSNKKGKVYKSKIDLKNVGPIKRDGFWHLAWSKEHNSYIVINKKSKLKLQNFLLGVNNNVPVFHKNRDTLDNRLSNLYIYKESNMKNNYEVLNDSTVKVYISNRYKEESLYFLISKCDTEKILDDFGYWTYAKSKNKYTIFKNTKNGKKTPLDILFPKNKPDQITKLNKNFFDFRRENIKINLNL
ncbi:hypothetical protein M4I33_11545 [Clostridium sp. LY3-2]|uniref:hypothetical protein n=1 Tax=Clostridium sp. LY3-2 TaxID=2942482 RepID=UPI0021535333|nr:hypothetical protein [Clostridium sp. LY3-2]MCR6515503.1 hypothetical protein [Clostridium sp. LY3-2]